MTTNIWSIDAVPSESYLIGAVMHDDTLLDELQGVVNAEMFADDDLRDLWGIITRLHAKGEPTDIGTVMTSAKTVITRLGAERFADIQASYTGRTEAKHHAQRVAEMYLRRVTRSYANEMQAQASEPQVDIDEIRGTLEQLAYTMDGIVHRTGLRYGESEAEGWMDGLEARVKNPKSVFGIMTGWRDLDEKTLGFQRQEITVVGGRTSVGKTAFAIETAVRAHKRGYKVGMFSLEMSAEQVRNRIAANQAQVSLAKVRTGTLTTDELGKLVTYRDIIADIAIDDTRGVSTEYITAEMKRFKQMHGLDLVIVDYLQEIREKSEPNDNAGSALGRVARKLRFAAKQCDCAVIALSQLKRDVEGKKPGIADLSGSAGIESAADVIILLHRDKQESPNALEVNVGKQRNGETGEVNLYYNPQLQRIEGLREEA